MRAARVKVSSIKGIPVFHSTGKTLSKSMKGTDVYLKKKIHGR